MAKKKKNKVVQMLSPEKYIKQKARTLAIYECWINTNWEDSRLATIVVSRKHVNNNITLGMYLVDLDCLGIKDSFYHFNIPEFEYRSLLHQMDENREMEKITYTLAHNIIFAGLEFAEDYKFRPHSDFSIAKYILEEDSEEIELIEIECGENDQPYYVQGPLDDDIRAKQIVAHLEKHAGTGNFKCILAGEDDLFDDDFEIDHLNKFDNISLTAKFELFTHYLSTLENHDEQQVEEFGDLIDSITDDYLIPEKLHPIYSGFLKEADKYKISDKITDDFLFGSYPIKYDTTEIKELFPLLYERTIIEPQKATKELKKLLKKYPEIPALQYLQLLSLNDYNAEKYETLISSFVQKFPKYSLFSILELGNHQDNKSLIHSKFNFTNALKHYFPGRDEIHSIELANLLILLLFRGLARVNIEEIIAVELLSEDFKFLEIDSESIGRFINMAKVNFILINSQNEDMFEDDEEINQIMDPRSDKNDIENSSTFQFKIQIKGITKPPVWRRITVPSYFTFLHLHHIIQAAFGWTNSHLFLFSEKGFDSKRLITQTYEDMDPGDSEFIEAEDVKLTDVFKEEKQIFTYIYDWGDNWEHKVTLEKIIPEISKTPDCHAGKGKCPPEDCGSIWGYSDIKEILKDPDHSEYESYIEWLGLENGESWNPNEFDLNFTKKILQNMFKNTEL